MEKAVVQRRADRIDPFGKNERPLKLTRRDTAVQKDLRPVVGLFAPDDELPVFDRYRQVAFRKTGDRERNAKAVLADLFDIVGRVPVGRRLGGAVQQSFEFVEPEKIGAVEQGARDIGNSFPASPNEQASTRPAGMTCQAAPGPKRRSVRYCAKSGGIQPGYDAERFSLTRNCIPPILSCTILSGVSRRQWWSDAG